MKYFDREQPAKNLPDYYAKSKTSNNYKLLQIEKVSVDTLNNDVNDLFEMLEINNATGKTLDMYGEMVNQQRGLATDDQYRFMIRSKIMQNLSDGDYGSVHKALYITFDCPPDEIGIEQSDKPCVVAVKKVPLASIANAGLNAEQTMRLIQRLMPVGVDIELYNFRGTFEFGETYEYDEAKGFGNVEQSIGGFFGVIFDKNDCELPI